MNCLGYENLNARLGRSTYLTGFQELLLQGLDLFPRQDAFFVHR